MVVEVLVSHLLQHLAHSQACTLLLLLPLLLLLTTRSWMWNFS
jgi:hypothetical protein